MEDYTKTLLESWEEAPQMYITSAEKKTGTEAILEYIEQTNLFLQQNKVNFNE